MEDKLFTEFTKPRKKTTNILALNTPGWSDDKVKIVVADEEIRAMAQNIIDCVGEHKHLKAARILILVVHADAVRKKLEAGEWVSIGKATKAKPRDRVLARLAGDKVEMDFCITLCGDWLDTLNLMTEEGLKSLAGLIDHELCHCGAKMAGEFVHIDSVDGYVDDLGKDRHVETCMDVKNDDDEVLVRYYHTKNGDYQFLVRKHEVEEFNGVARRHGPHTRQLARLIDVMVKSEESLFASTKMATNKHGPNTNFTERQDGK